MDRLDKGKYCLSIFEGANDKQVSKIVVRRIDCDPIGKEEVEDLKTEFVKLFPKDVYGNLKTKLEEDDEELHIFISLEQKERLHRTDGVPEKRVIVPKTEIEKRLKNW
jgi:hypothetical protein